MENPLKNLIIDYWYKAILVVGATLLIVAFTFELQADNKDVQMLGFGLIMVGVGEWINHPLQTVVLPPSVSMPAGIAKGHPWRAKPTGIILDIN